MTTNANDPQDGVSLDLDAVNALLGGLDAPGRIRWAVDTFGQGAVLLSSMQKTSSVLMHQLHGLGLDNEVLFVDTGFHFLETLKTRDLFIRKYGLNMITLYPDTTPEEQEAAFGCKLHLSADHQKSCCNLRKEVPLLEHLRSTAARLMMVGLRAEEGGRRKDLPFLSEDPRFDGYAMRPILDWGAEQVAAYLGNHGVPVHTLHARCYPSIGCQCCTTPVADGEDPRAGRWRHLREDGAPGPVYCGINFADGAGI